LIKPGGGTKTTPLPLLISKLPMSKTIDLLNLSENKIFSPGQSVIDQGRIRILSVWSLIICASAAGLISSIYFDHTILSVITAFTLLFCLSIYFRYIFFRPAWRQIAHAMLILATLVNFSDAYLASQNVNIITIQLILLTILFSFNMLGKEWGLFYSFLNLVPTLVFFVLEYNNNYFTALRSGRVDLSALVASLGVDLALIIVILSNFHRFLFNKLMKIKKPAEEELDVNTILELAHNNSIVSSELSSTFSNVAEPVNKKKSVFQNNRGLRLLIAEDNPLNVKLMKKLFAQWDIIPTVVENGERAIEIMQYSYFDIILMDLQMPVLDGFGAAKEIRNLPDPKKAGIPIIAVTAAAFQDIRELISNAGMNDYLSKPFNPDELIEKINNQLAIAS
jgi:CheY-like chemotaxis protein